MADCGATLPITGYLDRFSHRAGERFEAHVSMREAGEFRARIVRVISGDPNPAGPGMRFEDLSARLDRTMAGGPQPIRLGSYAVAPVAEGEVHSSWTWTALAWAALETEAPRAVLSHEDEAGTSVTLSLRRGGIEAVLACGGVEADRLVVEATIEPRRWYRLWASHDAATGRLAAGIVPVDRPSEVRSGVAFGGACAPSGPGWLLVGARCRSAPENYFDGRIEDPALLRGLCEQWPDPLAPLASLPHLAAGWDFSRGIGSQAIRGLGPRSIDGVLVNLPMDAVRGARWTGEELCWRHRPDHYAAVHFHSDDLGDCGWSPSFDWVVPDDLASGAYAFHLSCAHGEDWLPFYLLPAKGTATASVAFLAPTFSYQAYANFARGNCDDSLRARIVAWGAYPHNIDDFPIYGRSTYNHHEDGAGVVYSSRRRPILTMRPGYLSFDDSNGSGLRHYPADLHLLAWLDAKGIAFDVITDEDLDAEGAALLAPYRVVLTGTHPEYHTAATWDAIFGYTRSGGRLAYLGGNGFYWRIGRNAALGDAIEMRRSEGGTRVSATDPGEYYHSLDGRYSGMWRRNGRDPQRLVGIGFSSQGAFEATHYRRSPASRTSWLFAGIEEEIIGDYGLSAGGAAGLEFDRADTRLGTPRDAVILATSENPPASFYLVPEEILTGALTLSGDDPETLVRADMIYFELPGGGAVFGTGSITFCGSLWREGFEGPVSALLWNVVRGFSEAELPQ